jgi:hypothetical protein
LSFSFQLRTSLDNIESVLADLDLINKCHLYLPESLSIGAFVGPRILKLSSFCVAWRCFKKLVSDWQTSNVSELSGLEITSLASLPCGG